MYFVFFLVYSFTFRTLVGNNNFFWAEETVVIGVLPSPYRSFRYPWGWLLRPGPGPEQGAGARQGPGEGQGQGPGPRGRAACGYTGQAATGK